MVCKSKKVKKYANSVCRTAAMAKIAPRRCKVAMTFWVAKKRSATIPTKKGEIMHVNSAFQYLTKFKLVPDSFKAAAELNAIVKANEWDKKK